MEVLDDLETTCRACLKTRNSERMYSLQEEPLKSMFFECTFVKVKPHEDLPLNLCCLCVAICDAAYSFREMCEESDRKIRSLGVQHTVRVAPQAELKAVLDTPSVEFPAQDEELTIEMEEVEEIIESDGEATSVLEEQQRQQKEAAVAVAPNGASSSSSSFQLITCQFCQEGFAEKAKLLEHFAEQHQEESYNCATCSQLFDSLDDWRTHLCRRPVKEKRTYLCSYCPELCANRRNYAMHLGERHPGLPYPCESCERTFVNTETWRTHKCREEAWAHVCSFCDASFGHQAQLTRHLKTHLGGQGKAGEKPGPQQRVRCDVCHVVLHSPMYLKQHMMTHTGERPFKCPFCETRTRNKCNLLRHVRKVHKLESYKFSEIK